VKLAIVDPEHVEFFLFYPQFKKIGLVFSGFRKNETCFLSWKPLVSG